MKEQLAGAMFLGFVIGVAATYVLARGAAKARLAEVEERHQGELDRMAMLNHQQIAAARRGIEVDHELNVIEQLARARAAAKATPDPDPDEHLQHAREAGL